MSREVAPFRAKFYKKLDEMNSIYHGTQYISGQVKVNVESVQLHTQYLASLLEKTQVLTRKIIFYANLQLQCLEASIITVYQNS